MVAIAKSKRLPWQHVPFRDLFSSFGIELCFAMHVADGIRQLLLLFSRTGEQGKSNAHDDAILLIWCALWR